MEQHHHRASLTQTNKAFKAKHSSKGSLRDAAKGRTSRQAERAAQRLGGGKTQTKAGKAARRNQAKQVQANKRAALAASTRVLSGFKGEGKAPRVIAVLALTDDIDGPALVRDLLIGAGASEPTHSASLWHAEMTKPSNASLQFITPKHGDLLGALDACQAADYVVLGLSEEQDVSAWGENALRCLASVGIAEGSVRAIVKSLPETTAQSSGVRKSLLSFTQHFFPSAARIYSAHVPSEAANVLRSFVEGTPKGLAWRESRGRLLAEDVQWEAVESDDVMEGSSKGTLKVTGTIRGAPFSANRLVHLQGHGDFQLLKITAAPKADARRRVNGDGMTLENNGEEALSVLEPDEADDLQSTNVPDDEELLQQEQTWPTEDELEHAPERLSDGQMMPPPAKPGTTPKSLKRVPKGTSTYQAAWIIDEDDGEYENEAGSEVDSDRMSEGSARGEEETIDYETLDTETGSIHPDSVSATAPSTGVTFKDLPMDIEDEQYRTYLADRQKERDREARTDREFPDEVDTPMDIPARERFARYRGLKSFRTSPWDPYENLPRDYARCFMFQDYKQMSRKITARAMQDGVEPGTRVTLHIASVPSYAAEQAAAKPFLVFGLLQHEHKMSVLNVTTQRNTEYEAEIKSKDELILLLGPRRFSIRPLFSQHTQGNAGKGSTNVHKFERFLRHGAQSTIATAYLPLTFGVNIPAILLKQDGDELQLVGTGSLLSADPTRIIAKRVILTGHPYKIHKKTATIRYMFFNQADVDYFKPVQLKTKKGRTGYIKESLGTHGYMKASFDSPLQDQTDTVCLSLYKRCFPKWSTLWSAEEQQAITGADDTIEVD
ncbi:uncharacterized protein L969DRAFT_88796 [Mixia osmundae IAM 14324]|uniref:Bms1-type G domain-containing protein n=1 Tax=Mixia osmundae (strain CBS 9802 / IAM 14324 / JCM 22182 / KY 12970) TaxID=764103 RepID=G7E0I8_MIXOS|nr:uncharacterized protein L969DRAFT_88796 [Mixia osmundae IAM 14324]KEI38359.1 hypothetical protein L969DRAFT_88796 [Mixia osmundae IAM 14324]GAA96348.1 hypothetical protein E5Q_03014 [Mixia osmundae IAM 14324]